MKRILIILTFVFFTFSFSTAKAADYQIDDRVLDQIFAGAQTVSVSELGNILMPVASDTNSPAFANDKDPLVAIVLDLFFGYLGVHRFYLGTEPLTGIAYIVTCGGVFGVVPLIDLVVLAINYDDISPYVDNPKFFMW